MSKATLELTNSFSDNTTRKLTLGTFADSVSCANPNQLQSLVQNINNNSADLAGIYLSDNGANFVKISSAVLTISDTTTII